MKMEEVIKDFRVLPRAARGKEDTLLNLKFLISP